MPDSARTAILEGLRARLNQAQPRPAAGLAPYGMEVLRGTGEGPKLASGRVHEIMPNRPGHGAALGFLVRCLAGIQMKDPRPLLWVSDWRNRIDDGRLYAPGLAQAGLDPDRLILVRTRREKDTLWVLEEALGSGALAAVAGSVRELELTPSRRLSLATERTGTPLFLLRPHDTTGATAAETRWQVSPLPSTRDPFDAYAPGNAAWRLDLIRNRSGAPACWDVACKGEEDDTQDALDLAAGSGHRALATDTEGRQARHTG
ncbi:MAG: inducible mutagenesis protein A [Pseudomonadota bacterium]